MEKKGTTEAEKPRNPCSRIIFWIFAALGISLLILLIPFMMWTVLSYQDTIISLESRVYSLEKQCANSFSKLDIDNYLETKLEKLVNERISKLSNREKTWLQKEPTPRILKKRATECHCPAELAGSSLDGIVGSGESLDSGLNASC
ncbi:hypothetical protein LOTGIDRAFT_156623 [Lottia gigantea]|uniref:Uncharacterized protein n=1 Tax=Lottia gigantea TaxID=225164 RepID=V4B9G2_LOTGI|nr:hypothetical protein LOTGIDRAFT_156623 [Lottia gigantea]ESP04021.1 hypothetical protein LOTGIDRAFT_156623 [Lottia gigantea]